MLAAKLNAVTKTMSANNIDYIILSPSENLFYLTELDILQDERMHLMVISAAGNITFIVPAMSKELVEKASIDAPILAWDDGDDPVELVAEVIKAESTAKIAVDDKMWSQHLISIQPLYPQAVFTPASQVMSEVRIIKAKDEQEKLAQVAAIADQVMEQIISEIEVGQTEQQVAARIEVLFKEFGADDISFKPIVAAGENASVPHHRPSAKVLQDGDFVILDLGGKLKGYCSDITRTIALGEPAAEMKKVYAVVKEAQEAACQGVAPGRPCSDIDALARDVISGHGYGELFVHRTGHGIGIDIHEEPYIVETNKRKLEPGMAFSIEPGIYVPGKFGVRIEDIVIVGEAGFNRLNNFTRELIRK